MARYVFFIDGRAIRERRSPILLVDTVARKAMRCHGVTFDRVTLKQGTLDWKMGTWHVWGFAEGVLEVQRKSSVRTAKGTYTAAGPQKEAYDDVLIREIDENHSTLSTQLIPAKDTVIGFCTSEMMNFQYGAGEKDIGLWMMQQLPPSAGGIRTSKQITCLGPVSIASNLLSPILPNGAQVILQTKSPIYYYGYRNDDAINQKASLLDTNWPDEFYLAQPRTRPDVGIQGAFESGEQAFSQIDEPPPPMQPSAVAALEQQPALRPPSEFAFLVGQIANGGSVLDLGGGDGGKSAFYLHKLGLPTSFFSMRPGHPLHDPTAMTRQHSVVYDNGIIGRINSRETLAAAIQAIATTLADGCIYLADYPKNARIPAAAFLQALQGTIGGDGGVYPSRSTSRNILIFRRSGNGVGGPSMPDAMIPSEPEAMIPRPEDAQMVRVPNPSSGEREENPEGEEKPRSKLPFMTKVDVRQRLSTAGARQRQLETERTITMMKKIPFEAVLAILSKPETYSRTDLMSLYRYVLGGCIGTPNEIRKGAYPRVKIYEMISGVLSANGSPDVAEVFVGDDGLAKWQEAARVWGHTMTRMSQTGL